MFERGITVDEVADVLGSGKLIEDYATDFPYPSALWLGFVGDVPLHVVVAEDTSGRERIIITLYQPDPAKWEADWATRRRS
jgi:hypothetical protein